MKPLNPIGGSKDTIVAARGCIEAAPKSDKASINCFMEFSNVWNKYRRVNEFARRVKCCPPSSCQAIETKRNEAKSRDTDLEAVSTRAAKTVRLASLTHGE